MQKKKNISFLFVFAILVALLGVSTLSMFSINSTDSATYWSDDSINAKKFAGGTGTTSSSAYQISTAEELGYFATVLNGSGSASYISKFYKLTANINLSGHNWKPINEFKGNFDGSGFAITNINISESSDSTGFFKKLTGATIQNTMFQGSLVVGGGYTVDIGGIAGRMTGNSNLTKISSGITISATDAGVVGGLVGYAEKSKISLSYNLASVKGSYAYVGGIVGYGEKQIEISNVFNNGEVSGDSGYVGGVVGKLENSSFLINAYNNAKVTGNSDYVGGIAGSMIDLNNFHTLENNGDVKGKNSTGGIVGVLDGTNLSKAVNKGKIISTGKNVGGIVGTLGVNNQLSKDIEMSDVLNLGQIGDSSNKAENTGGIVGYAGMQSEKVEYTGSGGMDVYPTSKQFKLEKAGNQGRIYGGEKTGGLIGYLISYTFLNPGLTLSNSYNHGNIETNADYLGGIIGMIISPEFKKKNAIVLGKEEPGSCYFIDGVYNTGKIDGRNNRGGLIGYAHGSRWLFIVQVINIKNSFSSGYVVHNSSYKSYVGALIGRNVKDVGTNSDIYFYSSNASPNKAFGNSGKTGTNDSGGTAKTISSFTSSITGFPSDFERGTINYYEGSSTLKTGTFYVLKNSIYNESVIQASFDASNVWSQDASINDGKPYLKDLYWLSAAQASIFTIYINTDGGTNINDKMVEVKNTSQTISLGSPSRTGFKFDKWVFVGASNGATISGKSLKLPANFSTSVSVKATWTETLPTLSYTIDPTTTFGVPSSGINKVTITVTGSGTLSYINASPDVITNVVIVSNNVITFKIEPYYGSGNRHAYITISRPGYEPALISFTQSDRGIGVLD